MSKSKSAHIPDPPSANFVWWLMVVPVLMWILFFAGVLGLENPVYSLMVALGSNPGVLKIAAVAVLVILPTLAAVRALKLFSASRRHHSRSAATMRLFATGVAGIVLSLWALMLFIMSREV